MNEITREEVIEAWGENSALAYLVELLNKEYDLDDLIEDILSLREIEGE